MRKILTVKWQYLVILILGIFLGVIFAYYWWGKQAAAKVITLESRGISYTVSSQSDNVLALLAEQGLEVEAASVSPAPDSALQNGMTIVYRSSVTVNLSDRNGVRQVTSSAGTVGEFLSQEGISLNPADEVRPGVDESIFSGMEISIIRVEKREVAETERLNFETLTQGDPSVLYGVEQVIQEGKVGRKEITYEVTYKDSQEIGRKILSESVTVTPVPKIIKAGTKIEVESYEQGRASWYAYKGCMCAAHPYFPKGSFLRVTNLANGNSVIVVVNDWGPDQSVHPERVLDLDSVAFKQLAPLGLGTIEVKSEQLRAADN